MGESGWYCIALDPSAIRRPLRNQEVSLDTWDRSRCCLKVERGRRRLSG